MQEDSIQPGQKVVVIDDLLATGGEQQCINFTKKSDIHQPEDSYFFFFH